MGPGRSLRPGQGPLVWPFPKQAAPQLPTMLPRTSWAWPDALPPPLRSRSVFPLQASGLSGLGAAPRAHRESPEKWLRTRPQPLSKDVHEATSQGAAVRHRGAGGGWGALLGPPSPVLSLGLLEAADPGVSLGIGPSGFLTGPRLSSPPQPRPRGHRHARLMLSGPVSAVGVRLQASPPAPSLPRGTSPGTFSTCPRAHLRNAPEVRGARARPAPSGGRGPGALGAQGGSSHPVPGSPPRRPARGPLPRACATALQRCRRVSYGRASAPRPRGSCGSHPAHLPSVPSGVIRQNQRKRPSFFLKKKQTA